MDFYSDFSLVKRKEHWAEVQREKEKNKPDPDCPKGHKRVPEEERRKVLENLKKCEFEVIFFSSKAEFSTERT